MPYPLRKNILLLTFFLIGGNLLAQNQTRPDPYGQWLMYFGDNPLNDKWGLHTELQLRNYLLQNTVEQSLLRLGVNHYLNKTSMVSAGYAMVYTEPSSENVTGFTTMENRIWEQLILRHRNYNLFIEHRYRLEQRFIDNRDDGILRRDHRFRYRFQALLPLYVINPHWRHFFINTYNELFMNLGESVSGQIFDRNRLYIALGFQLNPKFNFQIGYLNQVISIPNVMATDVNHNLQIGVSYNLDAFFDILSR